MAWYSSWSGWDIAWGILTGGIHSAIKLGLQSAEAQAEAEKAAKEIEKLRSKTKSEVVNLPYLRGASNTVATGKTQPYLIGKHLLTPFILNGSSSGVKGYHTISGVFGDNSYYNVILDMGFNRQILNRIFCKDITLKNCTAEEPQEGIIHFPENNVFAGESSFMEVSQDGQPFETSDFNVKIVEQEPNELIELHPANESEDGGENDNYKDLYYTLESNSMALDIAIMINGLYHETSNGTRGVGERTVRPYFSLDYARLVAEGDSDPNAHATWRPIYFTRSIVKPAVIKTHKAAYYVDYTTLDSGWSAQPKEAIEGFLFSIRNNPVDPLKPYWHSNGGETPPQNTDFYIELGKCTKRKYAGLYYYKQYFELCWDVEESPEQILPWPGTLTETQTFSYNMSKQIMFNAHVDFDSVEVEGLNNPIDLTDDILALEYPVTIKITSPTRKPLSGNTNNATYIKFIHSYCYDKALSNAAGEFVPESILENRIAASSTLLGLHIQATKANEDKLDSIQVISSGIAKTWDGETWSVSKSVTSNPASWLLEVLTSAAHPASAMEESDIDSASFGAWYEYCEEQGLNINYVVTDGTPKLNLIEIILNAGRAETYRNPLTGKLCVAWDRIQNDDSNVPVLSEQNLVSFNWQKDLKRKPDGFKITYINAKEEYREDSIILMYERYRTIDGVQVDLWKYPEKRDPESVIEEITATGITSFAEAFNFGLYTLRCYNLRPKTVSASAGPYAFNFKPYQKILVQHPAIKKGMGSSEIKSVITDGNNNVTGAELYSPIELPDVSGVHYYCIITVVRNNGIMNVQAEISTRGFTREIEFVTPNVNLSFIESGNLLVYDTSVDTVVSPMILTGSSPSGNNWNLSLVDYNEDIFDDSEEIPEYTPHFSAVNTPGPSLPEKVPEFSVTYEKLAEAVEEIKATAMQAYIYADVTSAGFAVGDDNKTTQAQTIRIPCHVIIGNEEREFSFGTITAPSNWTVTTDYHTVVITVPANAEILQGGFNIPIKYREIYEDSVLVDEYGDAYVDEKNDVYHTLIMGDEIVTYKLPFGYVGVKGGNYKGGYNKFLTDSTQAYIGFKRDEPVVDAQGNPTGQEETVATLLFSDCIIGDYITWIGANINQVSTDQLVQDGLKTSRLYRFNGSNASFMWSEDTDQTHTMNALTDVFEVLDDELEENKNNNAVSYLDKLVANDCFVNRIVANEILVRKLVASDAFIDKLATRMIRLQQGGAIKSFLADNQFTAVTTEDNKIKFKTTEGTWKEFVTTDRFCVTDEDTESYSSLTYSSSVTVADLNSAKFLYVRHGASNYTYEKHGLKAYFKLENDTGKITARNMIADGGTFNNISAENINVRGGIIESLSSENETFTDVHTDEYGNIYFDTTNGTWHEFEKPNQGSWRFYLTNDDDYEPQNSEYSSTLPTVLQLNTYAYLHAIVISHGQYSRHTKYTLHGTYFKLDGSNGKIEASGGQFTNLKANGGEFVNINIKEQSILGGNVLIEGVINNQVLVAGGSLTGTTYNWTTSTRCSDIYTILRDYRTWRCSGTYDNKHFDYIKHYESGSRSLNYYGELIMYDLEMHEIEHLHFTMDYQYLPKNMTVTIYSVATGNNLKFMGIPNENPHIENQVYRDSSGNLKISLG